MGWWREALARLAGAFGRGGTRVDEEIQDHLRRLAADYERRGLTPADAARAARLDFGNPVTTREAYRDQYSLPSAESFVRDLRYAARLLRRAPGFTIAAVLTLAVGIGVNTTIFTALDAVALHPLPVKDGDRLVRLERWFASEARGDVQFAFSDAEFRYLTAQSPAFSDVIAAGWLTPVATAGGEPARVQFVSPNYLTALGVVPIAGALPGGSDLADGVVLSYPFWVSRYQGDPAIAGRTIALNGVAFTIAAVAPETFIGTANPPEIPDLWAPMTAEARMGVSRSMTRRFQLLAHLREGSTRDAGQLQMRALAGALDGAFPAADRTTRLTLERATYFGETNDARFQSFVVALMAAVALVLLIACANLTNMLLARGTSRHREIAMRLALGASRWRIFRQLLTESTLLALAGGAAGLACSVWASRVFWLLMADGVRLFAHGDVAPLARLRPDLPVFIFTCVVSCLAAALFGVVPALRLSTPDLTTALKDERPLSGRAGGTTIRRWFVGAQVAMSMTLLLAAGLLLRGLAASRLATTGYDTSHVFDVEYARAEDPARAKGVEARLVTALAETSGFSVMLADRLPLAGTWTPPMVATGRSGHIAGRTLANRVAPEYFATLGVPLARGRVFRRDEADAALAVISESAARQFWPGDDALGRTFTLDMNFRGSLRTFTVVGIARDVRTASPSRVDPAFVYLSLEPTGYDRVMVRAGMPSSQAVPAIRRAVESVDPRLITTVQIMSLDEGPLRLWHAMIDTLAGFAGALAAIALALALGGIYGVVAYLASMRRYEIGVRLALGARRADVLRLVVADALVPVLAGAVVGLAGALVLSALLRSSLSFPGTPDILFGVSAFDLVTFAGVTALVALAAAAASAAPLWRATRVDPLIALRSC